MNKHCLNMVWIILLVLATGATACSSAAPRQIAAAPQTTPIAEYPVYSYLTYHAYIELTAHDVDDAAGRATQMAYDFGGYLISSQSWMVDGHKVTSLELAVPTQNFERLRINLLSLGELVKEETQTTISERPPFGPDLSYITLQLRPSRVVLPEWQGGGWDPGRTFQRAFAVFLSIFGFLADILIWVVVVAGPFLLLGWLAWLFIRRFRQPPHSPKSAPPETPSQDAS